MNKRLKLILLIVGIALLGFGLYTLFSPVSMLRIGAFNIKTQSSINSYITIGLGIASIFISFIHDKSVVKPTLKL